MTTSTQLKSFSDSPLTREQFITLLNTALSAGERRYTRQLTVLWLSTFPGDLQVRLLQARSLLLEERRSLKEQALQTLEEICTFDPEFVEAQKFLAQAQRYFNPQAAETASNCVLALGGASPRLAHNSFSHPVWALQLRETRRILLDRKQNSTSKGSKRLDRAESLIHQVLLANPNTPLAALTHLRVIQTLGTMPDIAINNIAKAYLERWPKCIPIILIYAQTSIDSADSAPSVSMLHRVVSMDITGQVAQRLWGNDHPYRALWPDALVIAPHGPNSPQSIPVPAGVAAAYGWNRLPADHLEVSATPNEHAKKSATPAETTTEQQVNIDHKSQAGEKSSSSTSREGRFPVYVVFSTRQGLINQYGDQNISLIMEAMKNLVAAVRGRQIGYQNWGALLFIADDPGITRHLGIKSARYNDPWSLKHAINDLDAALAKRGERIGALIIIGGHEVVPFHHLPNPVEDIDQDVPSDNPYATRDENYFVLEWPIGRLPGGADGDPRYLISLLNHITEQHNTASRPIPWYRALWLSLLSKISRKQKHPGDNIGYSAAVWRRASLAVYRSIGDPRSLLISPPVQACEIEPNLYAKPLNDPNAAPEGIPCDHSCIILPAAQFGYFNLHGLADSFEWYGQRDPTDPSGGPDFPIALRPQDIRNSGHAPRVVFSEACYGAYIHGKKAEEAIAIKFLTSGTLAIVGSTSTCYGSISAPLIAADLLGRVYWGLISEGYLVGEALRRAKLYFAKEMHQRQGFLDGEDQKTLISFVLYGDPLAQPYPSTMRHKVIKAAPELPMQLLTISDQQSSQPQDNPISNEMVAHVRQVVTQYLPGMTDAQVKFNPTSGLYQSDSNPHTSPHEIKNSVASQGRQVVILSKRIEQANLTHPQLARLTLDKSGKLVKLVVSR